MTFIAIGTRGTKSLLVFSRTLKVNIRICTRFAGLCGNNNEDSSDDFENLENGEIYPDNQVASFGNQFQTPTKQE